MEFTNDTEMIEFYLANKDDYEISASNATGNCTLYKRSNYRVVAQLAYDRPLSEAMKRLYHPTPAPIPPSSTSPGQTTDDDDGQDGGVLRGRGAKP